MGVKINTKELNLTDINLIDKKKQIIGELRSAAFSPSFKKIVGIAMIKIDFCKNNQIFNIIVNDKSIEGEICNLPIT